MVTLVMVEHYVPSTGRKAVLYRLVEVRKDDLNLLQWRTDKHTVKHWGQWTPLHIHSVCLLISHIMINTIILVTDSIIIQCLDYTYSNVYRSLDAAFISISSRSIAWSVRAIHWLEKERESEWASEWVCERVCEWVGEWVCEWVGEKVSEWVSEYVRECVSEWVNWWASECSHILELRDSLTTFVVFLYNDSSDPLLRTSSVGLKSS